MVGSGAADRSKEAVGMMALHEALRSVCLNSDWTYSVFWTIRPRPRVRGGNGCKVGDDNGSLMLMWEDGFCRGRVAECLDEMDGEDPVRKSFSKMSIQLYNYGEGLMGKVASDKCHKWVFKEPTECEPNISNYWQSSFDALPPEWTEQFESGIQTIAVIQAGHGLLQLDTRRPTFCAEDETHFRILRLPIRILPIPALFFHAQRVIFDLSSSKATRYAYSPAPSPVQLGPRPMPSAASMLTSPNFQNSARLAMPPSKDETHMFLLPHSSESRMEDMIGDHENDIKWPNGLSFFSALTGRTDEAKLLFNPEGLANKPDPNSDPSSLHNNCGANPNEFLSLDSHSKMDGKFKRSFTLPARMATSSSSTSLDHHGHNPGEYRNEAGMYSDVMETFLE
ncbi:UNVERIFIED_CONTAM: protein RICE SALT SENSITIVE 3 [Sesamum calycinum]|uniref:Protein RICE SALT SENSITIVE 3 n=1 Tax=Sesamum calycinum TaxID=2727403 RepID=A0AAW2MBU3_9LAMI